MVDLFLTVSKVFCMPLIRPQMKSGVFIFILHAFVMSWPGSSYYLVHVFGLQCIGSP